MAGTRDLPTGTVTFLFSDIEGSTRLLKQLGRERYGALLTQHNTLLREAFGAHDGTEIDRQGDAFFFVFRSAATAVAAAAAAQRAMADHGWPEDGAVRVRVGVHTGEAAVNGDGYVGFAVHQAARIGDLGHGGQILVSRTTAALIEHELQSGMKLRDLGETRVPGLDRPEAIFQLVCEGLPDRFPPLGARRPSAGPPQPEGPTLLEREGELAALHAYVDSASSGAGRLIAIEGRAGMGKTRLLAEARAIATKAGVTVLSARAGELEQDFAYGIVRQLFEPVLAAATTDERAELLGGAAALAQPLFDDVQLTGVDEDDTDVSFAMLHGLYWLAANVALRRPAMIAIDDLHWADGSSLRWLAHLQRRLEGLPLLVAVATRPPDQSTNEARVTEILADPTAAIVRPTALGRDSVGHIARELFGREPDEDFVRACWTATGGNPLFVEALLDTIKREGLEPSRENAVRVTEIGPEPVARAVSLRLSRLPSEATVLVRAVAVLGGRAELRHAAALAGLERDLASHAATTLARADLLHYEMPLEFTHPVVRASVYDDMSTAERIAAHRRAATILAEAGAEPEQVAVHLEQSLPNGDPFVVETLRKAAQRALQRGSSDVAVSMLRRALDEPPPKEQYGEVVRALGLAERLLDNDEAIKLLARVRSHPGAAPSCAHRDRARALPAARQSPRRGDRGIPRRPRRTWGRGPGSRRVDLVRVDQRRLVATRARADRGVRARADRRDGAVRRCRHRPSACDVRILGDATRRRPRAGARARPYRPCAAAHRPARHPRPSSRHVRAVDGGLPRREPCRVRPRAAERIRARRLRAGVVEHALSRVHATAPWRSPRR